MKNTPGNTIIIRTTPEQDNWLHPQNDERKQRIKDRVEEAKRRYASRKETSEIPGTRILIKHGENGKATVTPISKRHITLAKAIRKYRRHR